MKIIRLFALLLTTFLLTCYFTACRKITGCTTHQSSDVFEVEIPITLYPAKDTFGIGDTIWIEQNFSEKMYDKVNGMTLDFSKFQFTNELVTSNLLDPFNVSEMNFQFAEIGTVQQNGAFSRIGYVHDNHEFNSKIGVIISTKGLFNIGFVSGNEEHANFTKCADEYLSIHFNLNNKEDNNFNMTKDGKDSVAINATKVEFDKSGGYCFYVK